MSFIYIYSCTTIIIPSLKYKTKTNNKNLQEKASENPVSLGFEEALLMSCFIHKIFHHILSEQYTVVFWRKTSSSLPNSQIGEELVHHGYWGWRRGGLSISGSSKKARVALIIVRSGFHLLTGNTKVQLPIHVLNKCQS